MRPLLNILNSWKKPEEDEEFVDKAVDSLFKKLKTKPGKFKKKRIFLLWIFLIIFWVLKKGAIEELEHAINNPSMPSKCVTIPRSLDGRLQVSHRKGLPHVIYCRIFRWPDLQSHHELRAIDTCEFSFSAKQAEVCINPYHYERNEVPAVSAVLVPKVELTSSQTHAPTNLCSNPINRHLQNNNAQTNYLNQHVNGNPFYQQYYLENHQQFLQNSSTCYTPDPALLGEKENSFKPQRSTPASLASPIVAFSNKPNNLSYAVSSHYSLSNHMSHSYGSSGSPHTSKSEELESSMETNGSSQNVSNFDSDVLYQSISYQEPLNWCSIVYYELNQRIGEVFNAASSKIYVDGYTNPCNNWGRRFCLGMFSNVNRNSTIENCRKHIGRGN